MMRRRTRFALAATAAGATAALAGCGLQPATAYVPAFAEGSIEPSEAAEGVPITVTAKNFTEQLILGKIAVLTAQAAGFDVTDLTNVPGSQPVRELMLSGQADMTWEYTGTAWLTYLNQDAGIPDPEEQFEAVYEADLENGLIWSEPAPLNNTYAIGMRSDRAEELGVDSIGDIAEVPVEERTLCVEAEFNSRSDGLTPMLEHYGIERGTEEGVPDDQISIIDTGAIYSAVDQGACTFGEIFASDGRIAALDLAVLDDDEGFFPAYNASAVFYAETLEQYPALGEAFAQVTPLITNETMQQLNLRVDVEGEEPADVAFDWMVSEGFISEPEGLLE